MVWGASHTEGDIWQDGRSASSAANDFSGWTVSTGGGDARGGDRSQTAPQADALTSVFDAPLSQAGLVAGGGASSTLLYVAIAAALVAIVLAAAKKGR